MAQTGKNIDLELAVICACAKPGQTLKLYEIAEICNSSTARIGMIEKNALKKIAKLVSFKEHIEN